MFSFRLPWLTNNLGNQPDNFPTNIGLPFRKGTTEYYLIGLDSSSKLDNIPETTKSSLGEIYKQCFSYGDSNTINNLNTFTEGNGITLIITDREGICQFIISLINNHETGHVELFNICKNFNQRELRGFDTLNILLNYFIPNNPIFHGYQNLRLALICNNPYLIPAFKTYCQLGFSVESSRQPVKSMLANYLTMSRPLNYSLSTDFEEQLHRLMAICMYNPVEREQLLKSIIN